MKEADARGVVLALELSPYYTPGTILGALLLLTLHNPHTDDVS